ncbi:MAG: ribokinase [Aestuariivirga sp.]|nr:ribokinase [Aestuariivirga sp.]
MSGLLQLSGIVVDLVHVIDRLPAAGEEVETAEFRMTAGGGFNAMAAARRMGIDVTYGGVLGEGPLADIASRGLAEEAIRIASSRRAAIDQGSCAVLVDRSGERSFITHHGAEREVDIGHLEALGAASCDFALLTGYSLYKPRSAAAFLTWLSTLARPPLVFFDPGPVVADLPRSALEKVIERADWISANAVEARVLTGEADPARAAEQLSAGRKGALVRRGADGCWLGLSGEATHVPGFAVEAIDTNGAGDTHDGVFIAALILGFGPPDAAIIANAAAALSTTRFGPATAPEAHDIRLFLAARGATLAAPGNWERVQPGTTDAHKQEESA